MRIEATDVRERKWENLTEATSHGHKSTALDAAADYSLMMAGHTPAVPTGAAEELMQRAVDQGSVMPAEIADILYADEIPAESSLDRGALRTLGAGC